MLTIRLRAPRWFAPLVAALALASTGCTTEPLAGEDPEPAELPTFTIRELGLLAGGTQSQAFAINAAGRAVGFATDAANAQRAVYFQGNAAIRLPEPANTTRSNAYDINDAGVIVGSVRINGIERPARWDTPTSQPVLLALPAPFDRGRARSINSAGVIAGHLSANELPVLWTSATAVRFLDPTIAESYEPIQLNDAGLVAGNAEVIEAGYRWSAAQGIVFLGSLEGEDDDGPGESDVTGLNNNGVTVGSSETADGLLRAFRWTEARGIVRLGEPPAGYTGVIANAVNDDALVAGNAVTRDALGTVLTSVPVVTTALEPERPFATLPTLNGARAEPTSAGINNCGVIVGFAFPTGSTNRRAVAWVPAGCPVL